MRRAASALLYPAWLLGAACGVLWAGLRWGVAAVAEGFARGSRAKPGAQAAAWLLLAAGLVLVVVLVG